ncbi:MAG: hypothetical protein ICV87_05710 [Gemmatimonadetes bacterium]|nr:hypothetical protein [Gemmatimonadota bacterium]
MMTRRLFLLSASAVLAGCAARANARSDEAVPQRAATASYDTVPRGALLSSISAALSLYDRGTGFIRGSKGPTSVCVAPQTVSAIGRGEPDSVLLATIRTSHRVVRKADCPRTYDEGFIVVAPGSPPPEPPRRPEGYVDPLHLTLAEQEYFPGDSARIVIGIGQGATSATVACSALREADAWRSQCRVTQSGIF